MASGALRFCMVTTFYPPYHFGGDGVFVYRLAEALAALGHRVDVIHSEDAYRLSHPEPPEVEFGHHPNVTLHALRTKRPVLSALAAHQLGRPALYGRQLRQIFAANEYDVIHYHNVSLMGAPALMRRGRGVKLYTTHEYWLVCPTHVLFKFDREACVHKQCLQCVVHARRPPQLWRWAGALGRGLRHVDAVLVPSRFAMERHRADGIDRPLVHLPHFVPPMPAAGDEPSPGRPFFLYVGRLEKLKGPQELVRIFGRYREADLLVVGSGGHEAEVRAAAKDLPHVKFLGTLHPSKLAALYRAAVAVLVPSICYETFGLTAAEALMAGTPAIVRRIGALTEIVEQSGGGFAFGTDDECVAAMEKLRTDPALRRELGERGRRTAQELWSAEAHLKRYLQTVSELLAQKANQARSASAGELLPAMGQ